LDYWEPGLRTEDRKEGTYFKLGCGLIDICGPEHWSGRRMGGEKNLHGGVEGKAWGGY